MKADEFKGHTPGPWTASIQRNKGGRDLGWIVEHANGRIGWSSLAYADTNEEATAEDPAREANARLIAAAPDLLAQFTALQAERDALRADAERYRWLRDRATGAEWDEMGLHQPPELDHAIDTARASNGDAKTVSLDPSGTEGV